MNDKKIRQSLCLGILLCVAGYTIPAMAEEVRIPLGQQDANSAPMPRRGMTKEQVEATFGVPDSRNGPTGEPPIYYWEYPNYTVYFEGNYVLHTVSKYLTVQP